MRRAILRVDKDKPGSEERVQKLEKSFLSHLIWFLVFFLIGLALAYLIVPSTWDDTAKVFIYIALSFCVALIGTTIRKSMGNDQVTEDEAELDDAESEDETESGDEAESENEAKVEEETEIEGEAKIEDERFTSYCGLCCVDCIPSREDFFAVVNKLDEMLETIQFEHYAKLKSEINEEFSEYPKFLSILHHIKGLRCNNPCRLGGGNYQCKIRLCAQSKNMKGCWECQGRCECSLLNRLRGIHPNLDYHLDLIEEMGPANWFEKRKEHYQWQLKTEPNVPADTVAPGH
jgi:hypothetical protein